ncbi:MAG TPA: hypothetical protein VJT72_03595 [Pseudonocardiaceae bacterium]|nr:hypothetical protein [Pseudonocardiaceae bacterium]
MIPHTAYFVQRSPQDQKSGTQHRPADETQLLVTVADVMLRRSHDHVAPLAWRPQIHCGRRPLPAAIEYDVAALIRGAEDGSG